MIKLQRSYLQLVLASLGLRRRVKEIDRENLFDGRMLVSQIFGEK